MKNINRKFFEIICKDCLAWWQWSKSLSSGRVELIEWNAEDNIIPNLL